MRSLAVIILLLQVFNINEVHSLNILAILPYQGNSHFFVFQPYVLELANRGHNVTVISHFPQKNPVKNYHDISLAGSSKQVEGYFSINRSYLTILKCLHFLPFVGSENCKSLLANEQVQSLWKNKAKFDLILVEQFNSDCSLGLAHKLGAPVVGLTSHTLMQYHYARHGIIFNPAVHSLYTEGGTKPTLYQRVERTILNVIGNTLYKYIGQRADENTLRQYFDDVPPLEELSKDMKLVLLYQHHSLFGSQHLPKNLIEVNGYHIAKPKPLPDDLKKFIDESEHGVIYVSFGSMLQAVTTPREKLETIVQALSKFLQRVIWKWEDQNLPGNPKNIYISNWLPQNDILAHPKVLAFYSHCGLLGTTEAMYHGKPIIAMPIFGDQPSNAAAVEESGMGVQIQISELTVENLVQKLETVLDPSFREQVKRVSALWHDRPMSPMDSAIYWTEYAARQQNFSFKSPNVNVPMYQYLYLDVLLVLSSFVLAIVFFITKICVLLCGGKKHQTNNRKKSKKQ